MAIESICSGCGQKLSVADEHAGKQARCPACGQIYTVPQVTTQTPSWAQETSPGGDSQNSAGPDSTSVDVNASAAPVGQFWMRSPDGNEYGPVDRASLNRWFTEGRVGADYQIREGAEGGWQPAELFRPQAAPTGNPYAAANTGHVGTQPTNYAKPDQSGIILAMGILAFLVCPILGIVAWVMGNTALKDIQAGRADPRNKGMIQVGYYLGIASVILNVLCVGGYIVIIAIAAVAGG